MDLFLLILRLALAAVFGTAGIAKLFDPAGSAKAAADFGVPAPLTRTVAYMLPVAELLIAGSLLFVQFSWFGAIGAAGLLLVFTIGMSVQLAKGNAPDCHCFGQIHSEPVGRASIARNVALLVLAAFLVIRGRGQQGINFLTSNQDVMLLSLGLGVIVLLAIAVTLLKRISDQQTELMRRVELMELVSREGAGVEREDVGHPHEGLPIGAVFPDFELEDLGGYRISLADLKVARIPLLFIFISPNCTPCNALIPEFQQWQKDLFGKIKFIFVSTGTSEDNETKFGSGRDLLVLLQKDRELAESVKARWTPTAVLMDAGGRIASHINAGDTAIRSLVSDIKTRDVSEEFTYFSNGNGHSQSNKVGQSIPAFSVEDISGRKISSDDLKGHQTLVTFWSPTCPFCQQMLDDLREWEKVKGKDDPALVVFSDGEADEHDKIGLRSPLILDKGHQTAAGFGMFGTPSAVLIDEDGRFISETATGAPDIWALVGRRK